MALTVAAFVERVGTELGVSDWVDVSQQRINTFADVSEDHQYIHVDLEKARATPFGGTIAHGLLTLAFLPHFKNQIVPDIDGVTMDINYGYNKIRFLSPVKSGQRVRGRFLLKSADTSRAGRLTSTYEVTVEIEDEYKPALIAEWVMMQVF